MKVKEVINRFRLIMSSYKRMNIDSIRAKSLVIKGILLISLSLLIFGCGPGEPEPINTDFRVEFKTRTFGGGAAYLIPNKSAINKDGSIEFTDLKVADAVKACLCDYQKINCNGVSSKVIIKDINKSLSNYVFINDTYKGRSKDPDLISQAIMLNMEKAGVISINERIKDIPRFMITDVDEEILKKYFKKRDPYFQDQTRCNANQTQRNDNPSFAAMKHISSTKEFLGDLAFCLGIDILIADSIKDNPILDKKVLFDIETTDESRSMAQQLNKYGFSISKYLTKSKVLEINITPQMINLTKEGLRK